ncbi:MAG: nucleoside triphosphate pyrophosphohydrolase [Bacteroidales bacterium]|jgi:XTP/dITP diphosphohydrolase|nr:nucleoside triphosphate pyrophosphohydrolase [Bacteroidales bacterium]MDD4702805.1 nucleoside triphosphate pyrophosphohydrolase [Bacteroidales bacterium]MDX9797278.1 nucleoside triphosphate pyrophosphohydrolase [Bacteroidales bacterium]
MGKDKHKEALESFGKLLEIMDDLREKCPWDKKQTYETLRHLTIEETYELADAIIENNSDEIKKEVGDLLLHIVFYAKIGSEEKAFDIKDVIDSLNEKLIRRHPHIYGDEKVSSSEQVKENWEQIKLKEGRKSTLSGVPKTLPALVKAYRIQDKARGVGFDWENREQVWKKVEEEIEELKEELKNNNRERIEQEFGDTLFALINYSRFIDVNPESALERTNKKFINRFQYIEEKVLQQGKDLRKMTLKEMDVFWNEAKKQE